MTTHFVNYILLAIGILTVLSAAILIILDKLKGDDMYFNLDVKEQELKKIIEDAEEILSELNYTSDVIVNDIEEKINSFNHLYKNASNNLAQMSARTSVQQPEVVLAPTPIQTPAAEKTTVPVKFKPVTAVPAHKSIQKEEPPKSKQQMIFELAEQGASVVDIAKQLNMGQGEVTLILSLKNEEN